MRAARLGAFGLFAILATTGATGCANILGSGGDDAGAAAVGGTMLGTYNVTATQGANTCGTGALGSQAIWQFQIQLSSDPGVIYWNAGSQRVTGTLASDGATFGFQNTIQVDMRAQDPNAPAGVAPCVIDRADVATGHLNGTNGTFGSFTGTLTYQFAVDTTNPATYCDDLLAGHDPVYPGEAAVVAALPCQFEYTMTGLVAAQ